MLDAERRRALALRDEVLDEWQRADCGGAVTADARRRKREADRRYSQRHRERLAGQA